MTMLVIMKCKDGSRGNRRKKEQMDILFSVRPFFLSGDDNDDDDDDDEQN